MNDFLLNLKAQLAYKNLSQKELSALTGISINTIRGWFSKDSYPDVFSAQKVAQALNTSVDYLVTGQKDQSKQKAVNLAAQIIQVLD